MEFETAAKWMQYRPAFLAGFLASTGLEFGPFLQPPPLIIFGNSRSKSFLIARTFDNLLIVHHQENEESSRECRRR